MKDHVTILYVRWETAIHVIVNLIPMPSMLSFIGPYTRWLQKVSGKQLLTEKKGKKKLKRKVFIKRKSIAA